MRITENRLRRIIRQVIRESFRSPSIDEWMSDSRTLSELEDIVKNTCKYVPGQSNSAIQCDFGSGKIDSLIGLNGAIVTLYTENLSDSQAKQLKDWIKTKPVVVGGNNYRSDCAGVKVYNGSLMIDLK